MPVTLPRPLRPMNLRSLNFATESCITAVAFRISPHRFSSLPTVSRTVVPSATSPSATTVNVTGSDLLQRQCDGSAEQTTFGLPVRTKSCGRRPTMAFSARSPANMSDIHGATRWPTLLPVWRVAMAARLPLRPAATRMRPLWRWVIRVGFGVLKPAVADLTSMTIRGQVNSFKYVTRKSRSGNPRECVSRN